MDYQRILDCARGWSHMYRAEWRSRELAAGYSKEEVQLADILGAARNAAYWSQRAKYGDPAYGHMLDGSGGWEAFREPALDEVILSSKSAALAEAAELLRQIRCNLQPAERGSMLEAA
jgi:hypothetical protein